MDIMFEINSISSALWIAIGAYMLLFVIQLVYYLYLFLKPYRFFKSKQGVEENKEEAAYLGITVIITAKNEAANLRSNLLDILEQDYPNFQVVVVNNGSDDSTAELLDDLSKIYSNLYVTYIPIGSEKLNNKKLAITVGIKAAKHDILLFTEPDSKPLSDKWILEVAREFNKGKEVVLGACRLIKKRGVVNNYIQYDNILNGIRYLTPALLKRPWFGIGRNMAYRKDLFYKEKGFSALLNVENGEDNLFIDKIANKDNIAVVLSNESLVESNVADSTRAWRKDRSSYLRTKKHLSKLFSRVFALEVVSRYLFYILFLLLIVVGIQFRLNVSIAIAVLLFVIRFIVLLYVMNKVGKIYDSKRLYISHLIFDVLAPIEQVIAKMSYSKR